LRFMVCTPYMFDLQPFLQRLRLGTISQPLPWTGTT
jgi:hypothetical protein